MLINRTFRLLLLVSLSLFGSQVWADWQLDNTQSNLNFVSIKKGSVAEIHQFDQLSGTISPNGDVAVSIDLNSVNTAIEIRDQRMNEHLFETGQFSNADLTAKVDPASYNDLSTGERVDVSVPATLSLHGESVELTLELTAVRQSPTSLIVISKKPVIVKADDFKLVDGITKLMEIAKLPSIATAVPVSFLLTFNASEN